MASHAMELFYKENSVFLCTAAKEDEENLTVYIVCKKYFSGFSKQKVALTRDQSI